MWTFEINDEERRAAAKAALLQQANEKEEAILATLELAKEEWEAQYPKAGLWCIAHNTALEMTNCVMTVY